MSSRLALETINSHVKRAQYAVRGPIVSRSMEINKRLKTGDPSLPFKEVISCNIVSYFSIYIIMIIAIKNFVLF